MPSDLPPVTSRMLLKHGPSSENRDSNHEYVLSLQPATTCGGCRLHTDCNQGSHALMGVTAVPLDVRLTEKVSHADTGGRATSITKRESPMAHARNGTGYRQTPRESSPDVSQTLDKEDGKMTVPKPVQGCNSGLCLLDRC